MENKKIIIAGGTGSIGQALAARWGKDNQIIILSRLSTNSHNNAYKQKLLSPKDGYHITYWRWDGRSVEKHWARELEGADIVINLAGRSVNCRYTPHNRREILESRMDATKALGQAIREAIVPPRVWVNAASATIYRHAHDRPQDEDTGEYQDDFSVQVCKRWEASFAGQRTPFTRKIALRLAITLVEGGVIVPYLRLVKLGLGGRQGSGRQMYSWVHIEDVRRALEWFLDHTDLEGTYNLSSPGPVTNSYFMSTLRRLAGVRLGLPTPAWLLKLGAVLVGTETELVLKSRWVLPSRLLATGFDFQYPRIDGALRSIVRLQRRNERKRPE
jgi:uncharacterized protein (TIGR01777 family)